MTPASSVYEGPNVLTCAQLSALIYESPPDIRRKLADIVEHDSCTIRSIPKWNSRVLVVTTKDAVYVVIRGTIFRSWRSWKANLKVGRSPWMKGKAHSGFLAVQRKAKKTYRPILNKAENNGKTVYFTGHSQGGSVSFLATIEHTLTRLDSADASNITFGQPRTVNKFLCRGAEARKELHSTRVANGRDIVVGVPFVRQGYDHYRSYYHYKKKRKVKQIVQRPGKGWYFFSASVPAHFMKNYSAQADRNRSEFLP